MVRRVRVAVAAAVPSEMRRSPAAIVWAPAAAPAEREAAAERERLRIVREAEEAEARAAAALLAEQERVAEAEHRRLEAERRAENERRATEAREEAARIRGHEAAIAQIKALADFGGTQMSSEQIKALKAAHSIEATPQRDRQKHSAAEEPITARIRRRTEGISASEHVTDSDAAPEA